MGNSYNRLDSEPTIQSPLGTSSPQCTVRELVKQVASHDTLVLIQGESGSGKEVVARSIHDTSPRRHKPFVPVNCGAIPADLLESELFGHEKGSFTGAVSARKGRFELAEGGTLFLDEIGDMSLPMQVKLLRVLQEKCFERVGGNETIHCQVRIVAATHRDLSAMIQDGSFRHDLYFRLNIFPIEVPPLREHSEDLPELIRHFLGRFEKRGMQPPRLTKAAVETMSHYEWPGNVRELENLLERLCITHANKIVGAHELPANIAVLAEKVATASGEGADNILDLNIAPVTPAQDVTLECSTACGSSEVLGILPREGMDLKQHMQELEKEYIAQALKRSDGTITKAAKLLGLQRTTLAEKIKKLDLTAG